MKYALEHLFQRISQNWRILGCPYFRLLKYFCSVKVTTEHIAIRGADSQTCDDLTFINHNWCDDIMGVSVKDWLVGSKHETIK